MIGAAVPRDVPILGRHSGSSGFRVFEAVSAGEHSAKAATVIIRLAALDEPPLRLLLGSDAVRIAEEYDLARLEADKKWRDLSVSTDFESGSGPGAS